jgi:nitronate monooxygenase
LLTKQKTKIDFGELESHGSAWKDIWSAGKGVATIDEIKTVAELVADLRQDYDL